MSNIKLVHSGGNSVSLTTPDSNPAANRTFKLPGADGSSGQFLKTDGSGALSFASETLQGYGVFDAQHGSSAQSVPVTTWTKIELKGEVADLDGLFDHSSTYRYTPQVAGWYYVAFHFIVTGMGGNSHEMYAAIYKNGGTAVKAHSGGRGGYGGFGQADVYGFVQMNGSSDYLEAYGWQNNASSAARSVHTTYTRMLGYLVRRT